MSTVELAAVVCPQGAICASGCGRVFFTEFGPYGVRDGLWSCYVEADGLAGWWCWACKAGLDDVNLCGSCEGSGRFPAYSSADDSRDCPTCDGAGVVW